MKKISKIVAFLAVTAGIVLGLNSEVANAELNDGFHGVPNVTTIEAGSGFSTTNGIKLVENGREKPYSVYLYKTKTGYRKVSSTHYISQKVNGSYMLRYESASKKHKAWRKVVIRDTKAPTFSGISDKTINQHSKFSTTSGISAYDSSEGKKGYSVYLWKKSTGYRKVSKKHYINTKYAGKYQLKYIVKDKKGNTTVRYRKITVKAIPKKTAGKAKTSASLKKGKTITIYPKKNDEKGFWYVDSVSKFYVHSYRGESLNNFNKGDILKFYVGGRWYTYQIYDKFVCFGNKETYPGASGREWYAPTRGKNMKKIHDNADLKLQTCNDGGYSTVKICLARPYNNSAKWETGKTTHFDPQ